MKSVCCESRVKKQIGLRGGKDITYYRCSSCNRECDLIDKTKKTTPQNCKHIKRNWCVNCNDWKLPRYCIEHLAPVEKCVKCGEI